MAAFYHSIITINVQFDFRGTSNQYPILCYVVFFIFGLHFVDYIEFWKINKGKRSEGLWFK